ncbi:Uncharacterised protein [Mycoplasmopsis maculosa]|uniref:Uncharacterized protein n=1 Tax=Mycoplasmopsis maculosa TaxID=114885 RepID=A0A449B4T8_9BACT|nr:hypothetical protein [Mycoplasmopsis maculosa]VEU75602.1 Uncharacterised protein [Mycoplasmopsis maculosa]
MINYYENLEIPEFTEEKLKEILHYTDNDNNPAYNMFKSKDFYRVYSGAKGVSKSFGRMVETIYRLVNEKIFCSVWCRNQYNHIKTTLRPTLEKVLNLLAEEHGLDYRKFIYITNEAAYWTYDDGGKGRAIYFQNWEKIQAFQGFTLQNPKFRFGELVIDEPLEDASETNKLPHEIVELYEKQEEKLPLLIQNTITRELAPDNFNINVSFLYNIFTLDHFLIQNYHNKVIQIINEDGNPNEEILNELIKNHFVFKTDENFMNGLGLSVVMYSKFFVPKRTMSNIQIKQLEQLKEQNYRLWVITVVGFAFNFIPDNMNYFMKKVFYDEEGNLKKGIVQLTSMSMFKKLLIADCILGVFWGYDHGIHDNASLVCTALCKSGDIIVLKLIEDIKTKIKDTKYLNLEMCKKVINEVEKINNFVEENANYKFIEENFVASKTSVIFSDNNPTLENLNILLDKSKINSIAIPAIRKPNQKFGIVDRQHWQKFLFENKLIHFVKDTVKLINFLEKQVIMLDEEKRNEEINSEIYDVINAFEMSCSYVFKTQYMLQSEDSNGY